MIDSEKLNLQYNKITHLMEDKMTKKIPKPAVILNVFEQCSALR